MRTHHRSTPEVASLENVTKRIQGVSIVDGVSLHVDPGEIVLITGESGSGKSTSLRMLAGIERPDEGAVTLLGHDLGNLSQKSLDKVRRRVAIGFQSPNLDTNLSVRHNLLSLAEATGRRVDMASAARTVTRLGLEASLDKKASVLSGGEKQRLAIARILIPQPELMLLDEPTSPLDHDNKALLFEQIAASCEREGVSALIVTHDNEVARSIAHRELVMESGRLITERMLG